MKKLYMTIALCASFFMQGVAQTTLTAGDIAVIGYNYDNPDQFLFVNLVDLVSGTQIKFTDNGWNGTALTTTEGTDTWTASTSFTKGSVISMTPTSMSFSTSGDQIFVYQGTATAPTFIYGISTTAWLTGTITSTTSRKPTVLTTGATAIVFSPERDNGKYNTTSTTGDKTTILAAVCNPVNWTTTDTRIASFPAYTFIMSSMVPEPSANPTALNFTNVKSYRYDVAFASATGAPAGYIVLRSTGGTPNTDPTDGTTYSVGDVIGSSSVAAVGTATALLQESVRANTSYGFKIYSYNGTGVNTNYRQVAPLSGSVLSNATEVGTYYGTISTTNSTFVTDLENRVRAPYTKITYDQYDETMMTHYAFTDAPGGQKTATCAYSGQVYNYTPPFVWYTVSPFSREHTWCVSWTPSNATSGTNEYCDQHHLFPVNQNSANGVRSNHPLGKVVNVISSYLEGTYGTDANGVKVYEPRNTHKGDAARSLLYMALRYDGINGYDWTFNYLNNVKLPALLEGAQDLNLLLQWHFQDLPDSYEISRNDYVQSLQQNRNPFVDHPDWVNAIDFNTLGWIAPAQMAETHDEVIAARKEFEFSDLNVSVWPNPMNENGYIGIESTTDQAGEIMLINSFGALISSEGVTLTSGMNVKDLNVSDLSTGTYIVIFRNGDVSQHTRFIVR